MARPDADIGRQIKEAAERRGISQQKLAKITGMSRRHINWIYQGGNAGIDKVILLMRALSIKHLAVGAHADIGDHPERADRVAVQHAIAELQEVVDNFVVDANERLDALRDAFGTTKRRTTSETGRRAAQLVKEVTATARRANSSATAAALHSELAHAVDRAEAMESRKRRTSR